MRRRRFSFPSSPPPILSSRNDGQRKGDWSLNFWYARARSRGGGEEEEEEWANQRAMGRKRKRPAEGEDLLFFSQAHFQGDFKEGGEEDEMGQKPKSGLLPPSPSLLSLSLSFVPKLEQKGWSTGRLELFPSLVHFSSVKSTLCGGRRRNFSPPLPPLVSKYPWKFVLVLLTPLVAPFEAFFEKKNDASMTIALFYGTTSVALCVSFGLASPTPSSYLSPVLPSSSFVTPRFVSSSSSSSLLA